MLKDLILVRSKEINQILISLTTIAFGTGIWAAISISRLIDIEGTYGFPWGEIISGFLIVVFWIGYLIWLQKTKATWKKEATELQGKISEESEATESIQDFTKNRFEHVARSRHNNLTSTLRELHSLVAEHLKNITGETNDAALNLIGQLQLIHDEMSHLMQTVTDNLERSSQISSGNQSALENNRETLGNLEVYIERRLKTIEQDHQIAKELQDQASVMSEMTALIENVAKQTTIVATNAKIEATRAGVYGAAFGIIADEVTRLSAKTSETSKQIIESIHNMGKSIDTKFAEKLDQERQKEETSLLEGLNRQLKTIGDNYLQLEQFNRETLDNINHSSTGIQSKVNDSLVAIQFQDITQQQIEIILKSLSIFQSYLSDHSCFQINEEGGEIKEDFDIEQIRKLYVMKKQRDIHDSYKHTRPVNEPQQEDISGADITLF